MGMLQRAGDLIYTFRFLTLLVTPFEKTVYPEFLKDILAASGPEFSVAIGLALKRLTL